VGLFCLFWSFASGVTSAIGRKRSRQSVKNVLDFVLGSAVAKARLGLESCIIYCTSEAPPRQGGSRDRSLSWKRANVAASGHILERIAIIAFVDT
jgi:hypothetical protein